MEKLKDIKPIVEIPDFSFYAYIFSISIFTIFLLLLIYKIIKILSSKKIDKRKEMIKKLKKVNFENPKKAAYQITKYGRELVYDDRSYKIFEELLKRLQKYKYKKEVSKADEETKKYFKLFLETLHE
ncbi:hypothetical protein [Nitrosophilus kaiyonis]|uniref:hypothetical protein n=1 Tax=Nitrosophilus kaiyonis TaxID=2930200 RepID=UPI00249130F1|nr:hypothetical protein [Nitrosophilus kaiyonis]